MKCKNCGGNIDLENGVLICRNCGSKFSYQEYFDNTEAFLCYIETDENGRRTKDSAIAQEIFSILEEKKVNTFYKRISLDGLFGQDAEMMDEIAIACAKVVIMIATSEENFSRLLKHYSESMRDKRIIPVFWGMDAYAIPKELNAIQALKYDSVGASQDLSNAVLRLLGRKADTHTNYTDLQSKSRKKTIAVAIICGFALALIVGAVIFALVIRPTHIGVIDESEKDLANAIEETKSDEELYLQAEECIEQEKYADAIEILTILGEYKDARKRLETCYAQYAGFYYDDSTKVTLHLQMYDMNSGSVEIYSLNDNGDKCTVTERIMFTSTESQFEYTDSENNTGNCFIELKNDKVELKIASENNSAEVAIPTGDVSYLLSEKTDMPVRKTPGLDDLKAMLKEHTTIGDIKRQGYEISFVKTLSVPEEDAIYRFDNTDIYVAALFYDITDENSTVIDTMGNYSGLKVLQEDPVIIAVSAPANLVMPDKIGMIEKPTLDDGFLYNPGGEFSWGTSYLSLGSVKPTEIAESTSVCFSSEVAIGEAQFIQLVAEYIIGSKYTEDYGGEDPYYSVDKDDSGTYYVFMKKSEGVSNGIKYSINPSDYSVNDEGSFSEEYSLPDGDYGSMLYVGLPYGDPGDTQAYISFLEMDDYKLHVIGSWNNYDEVIDYSTPVHYEQEEITLSIAPDAVFYSAGGEDLDEYMDIAAFKQVLHDASGSGLGLGISIKNGQIVSMRISS